MGLNANSIRALLEVRATGVEFHQTLTLGRQSLSCSPRGLAEIAARYGYPTADLAWLSKNEDPRYADDLLKMLGATAVTAMDYSNYEGAQLLHDLNLPIPAELHDRFDVVLDAGTLEHVFDFPTAIKNCIDLVECGGHLILITPINNYCGHGFYQFSPDLFFRTLSESNGFRVEHAMAWEESVNSCFYRVQDPGQVDQHPHLVSKYPVLMLIQARKTANTGPLVRPQQSDYVKTWRESAETRNRADPTPSASVSPRKRLLNYLYDGYPILSRPLLRAHRWQQFVRQALRQRRWFRRHSLRQEPGFESLGETPHRPDI